MNSFMWYITIENSWYWYTTLHYTRLDYTWLDSTQLDSIPLFWSLCRDTNLRKMFKRWKIYHRKSYNFLNFSSPSQCLTCFHLFVSSFSFLIFFNMTIILIYFYITSSLCRIWNILLQYLLKEDSKKEREMKFQKNWKSL